MTTETQESKAVKVSKLKGRAPSDVSTGKVKGLIYGATGIGKTKFILSFPKPYYTDTEAGAKLAHYQKILKDVGGWYFGPQEGSLDFPTVIEQMQILAVENHGYKTLVIDSITKLYQTAIANEAEKLGDKDAFGASKKPAIAQMRRMINWTTRLDMNVWFIAHETSEWGLDAKTGQRTEVGKIADVWDKLPYELDLVLQVQKRGNSRIAIVKKSRLVGFPDMDTFPLEYAEFASRYGKDFIEAEVKPIVLATPDQVSEIKRILELVRIDGATVEKLLSKAGAESWEELETDQAATTINWLNNKLKGGK